jgi:hypothetical protein
MAAAHLSLPPREDGRHMDSIWMTVRSARTYYNTSLLQRDGLHHSDGELTACRDYKVSDFIRSPEGAETQRKVWEELIQKVEIIQPGIMQGVC